MNKLRCECGHTLCLGDSCHECRQAVPATFYDYYLLVIEGLSQFQMWHTPIETHIVMEVVNVIRNINEAKSAFDILAATAMANHLLHYNGPMITDYFACPDGFIDELSNGFEYIWDDVEGDAQEIFDSECLRVYVRKPWRRFFNK